MHLRGPSINPFSLFLFKLPDAKCLVLKLLITQLQPKIQNKAVQPENYMAASIKHCLEPHFWHYDEYLLLFWLHFGPHQLIIIYFYNYLILTCCHEFFVIENNCLMFQGLMIAIRVRQQVKTAGLLPAKMLYRADLNCGAYSRFTTKSTLQKVI